MTTYFTGDTHFGHKFMVTFRHFGSIHTMDFTLIDQWNELIGERDEVWHLGDLSFHKREETERIFNSLHGRKHLIIGNHDDKHTLRLPWESVDHYKELKHEGHHLTLMHYPMLTWNRSHYGSFHLHGHSHGNLDAPVSTRLDVGIDATKKIAVSFEEVCEIMDAREYLVVDHHGD